MANELAEREAIRDLTIQYCFTADREDGAGWADCFTENAVVDFGPIGAVRGRAAIRDMFPGIVQVWSFMCHQVMNHRITLDGPDRAHGICYFDFRGIHAGEAWVGNGTYEDRFERESGRWKIAERRATFRLLVPLKSGWGEKQVVIPT